MNTWWRAYNDAVDHAKLCLLGDRAHRAWFNLMCVAAENGGRLPDHKVLVLKLRMAPAKVTALLDELIAAQLFDHDDQGIRPHNWNARQYKSDVSTERVKRFRDGKRNVSSAVSETPTETERKKDAADAAPPNLERQLFERGKQVAGKEAGGLIAKLLKAKKGDVALARAAIEQASTKQNAREYLGAVIAACNKGGTMFDDPDSWKQAIV